MQKQRVGIVGITGRIGSQLFTALNKSNDYVVSSGFARKETDSVTKSYLLPTILDVFLHNDYVIDFSNAALIENVLRAALSAPKPLIIGTTGWSIDEINSTLLTALAGKVPIIVAPNTSFVAWLQNLIIKQLATLLPYADYDIDIIDRHHRNKADSPSGTAIQIAESIIDAKKQSQKVDYTISIPSAGSRVFSQQGPRLEKKIMVNSLRSGQLPAEYEVMFASMDDSITLKYTTFNLIPFINGVLHALEWIRNHNSAPGIYNMSDVYSHFNVHC